MRDQEASKVTHQVL